MKKDILGTLVFFDFFLGIGSFVTGIGVTFTTPWLGWGMIVFGMWQGAHFYFLLWGVEEVIIEEAKK